METSTKEASKTSAPTTCETTPSATSLPASEFGLTHSDLPAGPTTGLSGPARVRANLSARQAKEAGLLTSGTYGLRSSISSSSADLELFLASRLRARMGSLGSTLFTLTWKERATPLGLSISALRASGRRISDSDCSSWPTPMAGSPATEAYNEAGNSDYSRKTVALASWPTPKASDCQGGRTTETAGGGNAHLDRDVRLASWATPAARDGRFANAKTYKERGGGVKGEQLNNQAVHLAGWATPNASAPGGTPEAALKRKEGLPCGQSVTTLDHQVQMVGPVRLTAIGILLTGSSAQTENGGQLSPRMSAWLQGLPPIWDECAPTKEQMKRS